jgi:hypothetical protein
MKRSSKPLIFYTLTFFVSVVVVILIYVSTKLQCEELLKNKVHAEENIRGLRNDRISLTAQYQNYGAEEIILNFAFTELKMVRRSSPHLLFNADKEKIKSIEKIISKKYE